MNGGTCACVCVRAQVAIDDPNKLSQAIHELEQLRGNRLGDLVRAWGSIVDDSHGVHPGLQDKSGYAAGGEGEGGFEGLLVVDMVLM